MTEIFSMQCYNFHTSPPKKVSQTLSFRLTPTEKTHPHRPMIKTIRKNRLATAPVYFSDKDHTIVLTGKKGFKK